MLIAQISDVHLRADGPPLIGGADTIAALAACVEHVNGLAPRPDVVLATGVTASVGMLAVLADTPVTHGHVPAELPRLLKAYTSKVHIQCLGGGEWDTFGRYQGGRGEGGPANI